MRSSGLIALSLELSLLEEQLDGDPAARERLGLATAEIAASLEELREVARGIHPAVVSGHGLEVALEQLVARAPVPVRLTVSVDATLAGAARGGGVLPGVSESLANVGKYAQASSATVEVSRGDRRRWSSKSSTTASVAPIPSTARACVDWRTVWRRLAAGYESGVRSAAARG